MNNNLFHIFLITTKCQTVLNIVILLKNPKNTKEQKERTYISQNKYETLHINLFWEIFVSLFFL